MFANKLVAVMNEKIESGIIINSLAHMCIDFGSDIGKEPCVLQIISMQMVEVILTYRKCHS